MFFNDWHRKLVKRKPKAPKRNQLPVPGVPFDVAPRLISSSAIYNPSVYEARIPGRGVLAPP